MSTKLHGAPPLTITQFRYTAWDRDRHINSTFNGIEIKSGNDILFFKDCGPMQGRRYFNPATGESRFGNCGDGHWYTNYRPIHPSKINPATLVSVDDDVQGEDALDYIIRMSFDCPAIRPLVGRIIKRYGAMI